MLYPGTIFGIAAHVSGETAKAVSTAVLSMPGIREMVAGHGFWSGQGFVQDAQARTICSSSGQSDDGLLDEVEGLVRRFDADGSGLGCLYVSCEASG